MSNRQQKRNNRQQQVTTRTETRSASYSGPLPPASEMEKYHQLNPEYIDRIISMAEKQQELESKALDLSAESQTHAVDSNRKIAFKELNTTRSGQFAAVLVCTGVLFLAYLLISKGEYTSGTVIVTTTVGAIIGSFLIREKREKSNQ